MSEQNRKPPPEPSHAERFVEMVKRVAQTSKTAFDKAEAERKAQKAAEKDKPRQ